MDERKLRADLVAGLRRAGLKGPATRMFRREAEVTWVVEVSRSRFESQFDVAVGVDLDQSATVPPVNFCPIFVDLVLFLRRNHSLFASKTEDLSWEVVFDVLRTDSEPVVGDRSALFAKLGDLLGEWFSAFGTRSAVEAAVVSGQFDVGFVDKKIRQRLDAWPSST